MSEYKAKTATCAVCGEPIHQWEPRPEAIYVHTNTGFFSCAAEFQPAPVMATPAEGSVA